MVEKNEKKDQLNEGFLWELNSLKKEVLDSKKNIEKWDKSNEKKGNEKIEANSETQNSINSKLDFLSGKVNDTLNNMELDSELDSKLDSNDVNEFFEKWKDEFNDNKNTTAEKKFVSKSSYINEDRPQDVVDWINNSADKILDEIKNWKQEQNPVARSLLRIVNWIMKSE